MPSLLRKADETHLKELQPQLFAPCCVLHHGQVCRDLKAPLHEPDGALQAGMRLQRGAQGLGAPWQSNPGKDTVSGMHRG